MGRQLLYTTDEMEGWKNSHHHYFKRSQVRDFPSGPVVKTLPLNEGCVCLIHGRGTKIPHAWWPKNQNIEHKHYVTNLIKFKNDPHQKNIEKKKRF